MAQASPKATEPFVTITRWMLGLMLLIGTGLANASEQRLLVIGDSLSAAYGLAKEQGWVALLSTRLALAAPEWRVINASVSGETTAGGASRIDAELATHTPTAVVIELGANDGLRGLPLDLTRANLERMINAAHTRGAKVALIGIRIPPNYGPDYTRGFEAMYVELAEQYKLDLLPFLLEPIAADRNAFQDDNLHPTADAQPALAEHVWPLVAKLVGVDGAP